MSVQKNLFFKLRVISIFLIAAGYGWAGGHFIAADAPILAYLFQIMVICLVLILSVGFFNLSYTHPNLLLRGHWTITGLTIFTSLSLLINIGNIIRGATNHSQYSFGSNNRLSDLFPITILIGGNLIWLTTIVLMKFSTKKISV
jgi:hypothetical protein